MNGVIKLSDIVQQEVRSYATRDYNLAGERIKLYFVENPEEQVFAVLGPYDPADDQAELVMMVRIIDNQVIIDFDKSSKSLYSSLRRAGVPEQQLVVAGAVKRK